MYLGIDIGGTKTLLAVFDHSGQVLAEHKIPTAKTYSAFIKSIEAVLLGELKEYEFSYCCCAVPDTTMDRGSGVVDSFGNLSWRNVPIKQDLGHLTSSATTVIENDAKLAALFEFNIMHDVKKLLYITIGTGIGIAVITDGKIDLSAPDTGGHGVLFEHEGKSQQSEDFASGRALAEKYGKRASQITDPGVWQVYAAGLAKVLVHFIELYKPDKVVVGGGIGAHFEKFEDFLKDELLKYQSPKLAIPPVIKAQKPEEAVIYGCYEYIKQNI